MRELYIGRRTAVSEDGSPYSFDYYILVEPNVCGRRIRL